MFETTVGRILFNDVLPDDYPFINEEVGRKKLGAIIDDMIVCSRRRQDRADPRPHQDLRLRLRHLFRHDLGH